MDSDLEVLILIPTASHSAANWSSKSWWTRLRSRLDEASKTTSSAKSRHGILRPPNQTPSAAWLRREILSIKIVVGPSESGPMYLLRAKPSRTPLVKVRPPGARQGAPPPGLAPGGRLKCVVPVLSLLLLCALVGLCAVGVLYMNKSLSFEALRKDNSRVVKRLSVQEHNAKETERKYEELKIEHRRTQERFSQCSECQKCAQCGEGWRFFGASCYYFSTDELNWMMSQDSCTEKGGHMVIITNREEQDFLSSYAGETRWIGLNDLETEGQWKWLNNQSLAETGVTFWYEHENGSGEPDNWKVVDPSGENCAALGVESGNINTWFDASCQTLKKYICEK
ncbi:uncharacterized protein [Hoplias malabaricus]|uniref:uncharacterized protein n=1 Tax=Hoplias malabaricus TaxID=27720 RepID=UPI00346328A6